MFVNKKIFAVMMAVCLIGFTAFAQPRNRANANNAAEAAAEVEVTVETTGNYDAEVMSISETEDGIDEGVEISASPASDFIYEVASDYSSVLIIRYKGNDADVVIPAEIEGIPVTGIGTSAFLNNTTVESVIIPDTVISLTGRAYTGNDGCFKGCTSLKSVVIPDTIDVIPEACFYGCASLEDIVLPVGLTEIPSFAFYKCSSLTSLVVPDGVTSIGRNAFSGCTSLEDFFVPESITQLRFGNYHVFEDTKFVLSKKQEIYKLGYKGHF